MDLKNEDLKFQNRINITITSTQKKEILSLKPKKYDPHNTIFSKMQKIKIQVISFLSDAVFLVRQMSVFQAFRRPVSEAVL